MLVGNLSQLIKLLHYALLFSHSVKLYFHTSNDTHCDGTLQKASLGDVVKAKRGGWLRVRLLAPVEEWNR